MGKGLLSNKNRLSAYAPAQRRPSLLILEETIRYTESLDQLLTARSRFALPKPFIFQVEILAEVRVLRQGGDQLKVPRTTTASPLINSGRQDLVNLAREILVNTTEQDENSGQGRDFPEISTMEKQAALESPTSGFTAVNVNGKEQYTSAAPLSNANGNPPSRRGSDERSNGQPRISPPGQEKLTITTTTTQKGDWAPPVIGDRQPYHHSTSYSDAESTHKRKRSGSIEQNSSSATSYLSHPITSSTAKETPTTATTESDGPRDGSIRGHSQSDSRDSYNQDGPYRQYMGSAEESTPGVDHWQARQYPSHSHNNSDDQLGEVLQRASQNMDSHHRHDYDHTSPGEDDRSANPYSASGYDRREMSAQSDPKKRKRNFSNRTKTGCMTCRRRKKKCDETRPECNNCLRGGFVCSGYQQRGQWPKTEQKQAPIPLQSKTEYENAAYNQSSYNPQHMGQPRREPLPGYRGQTLRVDPQHGRPLGMDDDQPSASTMPSSIASPENNRLSAISYSQQTPTPVTASNSAYPDRQLKNAYERPGPLHDLSRQEPRPESDGGTPQSTQSTTLPQILHPQMHTDVHSNAQVTAQLALSNLTASGRQRTQKEEMLAGRHYFPFDKELVLERERCNGACWRFNSSTNPNNGVSPEERARLFRDILQPREHVISPTQASPVTPVGRVGDNVVVEAPFNCDYGYNISIGQDVAIGKNCTILDTCEVKIGDRCNIGPNVNIYTATLPVDPKRRLGSRGPNLGKKITIDPDCWIGGGVTILPGRTIGKGSTVGAGSIVTRDVPPYTVVCGNPARVIRGLYPPHEA